METIAILKLLCFIVCDELLAFFFLFNLQVLAEKLPELLDFTTDLKSLEASTKVHLFYVNT